VGMSDDKQQKLDLYREWKHSLILGGQEFYDYLSTVQSYLDFAEYYHKRIQEDNEIAIPFKILYGMIYFIEESTTDINEQFGGCTNLEKLIESNEMPELYYKLVELQRNIRR
jgi:hypothetical protein